MASKRKSDAISATTVNNDEEMKFLKTHFQNLPKHQDVVIHFQRTTRDDTEHLGLHIFGANELLVYPNEEFKHRSLAMIRALAKHFPNIASLELGNFCGSAYTWCPTLTEVLQAFGDAGTWESSLKSLLLRYWTLGRCDRFSEDLTTVPSTLTKLKYSSGNHDQVHDCAVHLNKFAKRLARLESLSVSFAFSLDYDAPCQVETVLHEIHETCPHLSDVFLFLLGENHTDNVTNTCMVLSHLVRLQNLTVFDCLTPDAAQRVLHATNHCAQRSVENMMKPADEH